MTLKIYVASSWRNRYQPDVVTALREAGHEVYDFRNPGEGRRGFSWSHVDPNWTDWSVREFASGLSSELAGRAFALDQAALEWCTFCVLVLPSGMSAHLEAGWCAGKGKPVAIYAPENREAELMYKLFDEAGRTPLFESLDAVLQHLLLGRDP